MTPPRISPFGGVEFSDASETVAEGLVGCGVQRPSRDVIEDEVVEGDVEGFANWRHAGVSNGPTEAMNGLTKEPRG